MGKGGAAKQEGRSLFDYAASVAEKHEGMAQAEANAREQWKATMLTYVYKTCRKLRTFTADDVFEMAIDEVPYHSTHERRAFGPVMLNAAKNGWCKKADCAPRNSRRRTLHASPLSVWDSLIYEGPR